MKIICDIRKTIIKVYTFCMIPLETHIATNHEIIIFLVGFWQMQWFCWSDNVKLFFSTSGRSDHRFNNSFRHSFIDGECKTVSLKNCFLNRENATELSLFSILGVVLAGPKWILFFAVTKKEEFVEDLFFSFLDFSSNTFGFLYIFGEGDDLFVSCRLDKVSTSLFHMLESCNSLALSIFNSLSKKFRFKPAFTWYVLLMLSIIGSFSVDVSAFLSLNMFSTTALVLLFIFASFITSKLCFFSVFAWIVEGKYLTNKASEVEVICSSMQKNQAWNTYCTHAHSLCRCLRYLKRVSVSRTRSKGFSLYFWLLQPDFLMHFPPLLCCFGKMLLLQLVLKPFR